MARLKRSLRSFSAYFSGVRRSSAGAQKVRLAFFVEVGTPSARQSTTARGFAPCTAQHRTPPPRACTRACFCLLSVCPPFFFSTGKRQMLLGDWHLLEKSRSFASGLFFSSFVPLPSILVHSKNVFFGGYSGARAQRATSPARA